MGVVYDTIMKRRTIRRFTQKPISRKILSALVNCGRLAPSAANMQPLEFIVVDNPSTRKELFETLKWAGYIEPQGTPSEEERPTAYIVVLINRKKREEGGERDAAAAIENMILAALEEEIGSCWLGAIARQRIKEILFIPDHVEVDSVLALGYPAESPVVERMGASVKYWKDRNGELHVPKRQLEDIMFGDKYGRKLDINEPAPPATENS